MYQHRQHIVLAADDRHVVLESCGLYCAASTSQHADDVVFQSLIVHLDIMCQCIVSSCTCPKAATTARINSLHDRIGIENRTFIANLIAVVPLLQLIEIHVMLFSQYLDFIFGKPKIRCHTSWLHHRIFLEIVKSRFCLVFLNRQNPCHVNTGKYIFRLATLEHSAQPVHITVHGLCVRFKFTTDGIPLVDDEYERLVMFCNDTDQESHQVVTFFFLHVRVALPDVGSQLSIYLLYDALRLKPRNEVADVEKDNRILVEVLLERCVSSNLQVSEQLARVACPVVVGA